MNIIIFLIILLTVLQDLKSIAKKKLFWHKLYIKAPFWMETFCPMLSILETLWPETFWAETFWADTEGMG